MDGRANALQGLLFELLWACATWTAALATCLWVLALAIEVIGLTRAGVPTEAVIAGGLSAVAVTCLAAALAAPCVCVCERLGSALRSHRRLRFVWLLPAGAIATWVAWLTLDPEAHLRTEAFAALTCLAGMAVCALVWLSVRAHEPAARLGLLLAAVGGLVGDFWVPTRAYPELHDVVELLVAVALVGAFPEIRARFRRARALRLGAGVISVLALSSVCISSTQAVFSGWRSLTANEGRVAVRMTRLSRVLLDRDGDGYSPIWGGGDCDDLRADVHPGALDLPGAGDQSCNGVDPEANPTRAQLGFAETKTSPALAQGSVDWVLLLSIDTFRHDVLQPEHMPALFALSERGVRFTRFYASGSLTPVSLPLMHKPTDDARSVIETLAELGVASYGISNVGLAESLTHSESCPRDAKVQTDRLLERLAQLGPGPQLIWAHYLDLHDRPRVRDPRTGQKLEGHAAYFAKARSLDRELARLLEWLEQSGKLARTAVIVVGDHGEGLGEHGVGTHGQSGFEAVMRTSAFVVAPGIAAAESASLLSHRGLPATLLGAFGHAEQARAAERFGQSHWRAAHAPAEPIHRFIVSRSSRFSSGLLTTNLLAVLVEGPLKLVVGLEDQLVELYDLSSDPGELHNLVGERPGDIERLGRKLALYCDLDRYPATQDRATERARYGKR